MKRALVFSILCGISATAFVSAGPSRAAAQDDRILPGLTITSVETTTAGDRLILRFDRRLRSTGSWQIASAHDGFDPFVPGVRLTEVFPSGQFLELLFEGNVIGGGFANAAVLTATTSPEGTDGTTLDPEKAINFVNGIVDASEPRLQVFASGDGTLGSLEGWVCNVAGTVVEVSLSEDTLTVQQFADDQDGGTRGGLETAGIRVTVPAERRGLFFVGQDVTASGFTTTDSATGMLTINTGSDGLKPVAAALGGPRAPITPTVKLTPDVEGAGETNESTAVTVRGGRFTSIPRGDNGFFAAGGLYRYEDSAGSMTVYISPTATDIVGRPIPTGDVDITGVVVQLDDTLPYTGSYALAPRGFGDIGASMPNGWIFWE